MNGTMQLIMVGAIVTGAAVYLVWRMMRSWRISRGGCGGSCGCATANREKKETHFVPVDQLTVRPSEQSHETREIREI